MFKVQINFECIYQKLVALFLTNENFTGFFFLVAYVLDNLSF